MSNEIGFALEIPKDVLESLNKADKLVAKIAKTATATSNSFNADIAKMTTSVGGLLSQLNSVNNALSGQTGLALMNSQVNSLTASFESTTSEVVQLMQQVKEIVALTKNPKEKASVIDIAEELKDIGQLNTELDTIKAKIDKLKMARTENRGFIVDDVSKANAVALNKEISKLQTEYIKVNAELKTYNKYEKAMALGESTTAQRANKLQRLAQAQKELTASSKDYTKELDAIKQATDRITQANEANANKVKEVHQSQSKMLNITQQLARQAALIFSVSQIEGYISKLVEVRGEFELQQKSLQAIMQNKYEADKVFGQVVDLSVRSPFRMKELVSYTKQLAAYRVENDKLFDSTKMLADISAGLGVDMSRLILAYGQVKAANYLRGTELRQFSEAGINILGELAQYFSIVQGEAVTTAEVFEMVSNRMVKFEDVAKIFQKMTSEGGIFFNMQEIQAETLAGQVSNLYDAIDVMLNKIGKDNEGSIKGMISTVKYLVDNYEMLEDALKAIVVIFVGLKINAALTNKELIATAFRLNIIATTGAKSITMSQLLSVAFRKLSLGLKSLGAGLTTFMASGGGWLLLVSALVSGLAELWSWNSKMQDALNNISDEYNKQSAYLQKIIRAYDEITKSANKAGDAMGKASEKVVYSKKYEQLVDLYSALGEQNISIDFELGEVNMDNIDVLFAKLVELKTFANDVAMDIAANLASGFGGLELGGLFGDNLGTDAEELNEALNALGGKAVKETFSQIENGYRNLIESNSLLRHRTAEYIEELNKGIKPNETEVEWLQRRLGLLSDVRKAVMDTNIDTSQTVRYSKMLNELMGKRKDILYAQREIQQEINGLAEKMKKSYNVEDFSYLTDEEKLIFKGQLQMEVDKNEATAGLKPEVRDYIVSYYMEQLKIPIVLEPQVVNKSTLTPLQESLKEVVKDTPLEDLFGNILKDIKSVTEIQEELNKAYKESIEDIEILEEANVDKLKVTKLLKEETDLLAKAEEDGNKAQIKASKNRIEYLNSIKGLTNEAIQLQLAEAKATKKAAEDAAAVYNLTLSTSKTKSSKNPALEQLKEQLSLIRELNNEYEKQRKYSGKDEALETTLASYKDKIAKLGLAEVLKNQGLTDADVVNILNFDHFVQTARKAGKDGGIALADALGDYKAQLNIEAKITDLDAFKTDLEGMMESYDLSIELQGMGFDENSIKKLFPDFDTIMSLEGLSKRIEDEFKKIGAIDSQGLLDTDAISTEQLSVYQDLQSKLSDMQSKRMKDDSAELMKWLVKSKSDRLKLEEETTKALAAVNRSYQQGIISEEAKLRAESNIQSNFRSETAKLDFEDLKAMDLYKMAFEDLDRIGTKTINHLYGVLLNFKDASGEALDPESFNTLMGKIKDLRDEVISRNPFEALVNSINQYREATDALKQAEIDVQVTGVEETQARENLDTAKQEGDINKIAMAELLLAKAKERSAQASSDLADAESSRADAMSSAQASVESAKKDFGTFEDAVNGVIGVVRDFADGLGIALDPKTEAVLDGISQGFGMMSAVMGVVVTVLIAIEVAGTAAMATLLPLVAIGAALGAVFAVFKIHDAKRQEEIDAELKKVERLQKAYEELEYAFDLETNTEEMARQVEEMKENTMAQVAALEKAIAAERDKKKTDEGQIDDWLDQQEQLLKEMREFEQSAALEAMGGVGFLNYKSMTEEFISAWEDLFLETGDGIDALEEKFEDMMLNIVRAQAMSKVADSLLKPFYEAVDKAVKDGKVTDTEWSSLMNKIQQTAPDLAKQLEELYKQFGFEGGGATSSLSELQRGIQAITEPTGQALESLLNSMRFDTNQQTILQTQIADSINSIMRFTTGFDSPMYMELYKQTGLLNSINVKLESVIASGHPTLNGDYIKVNM